MRWELFHRFAHRVLVENRLGDLLFGMAFLPQASSQRNQIRHVGSEDLRWFLWVQRKPPHARRDKPTMTGLIRRLGCVPGEMPTARQNNEQINIAGLAMSFRSPEKKNHPRIFQSMHCEIVLSMFEVSNPTSLALPAQPTPRATFRSCRGRLRPAHALPRRRRPDAPGSIVCRLGR